MDVPELSLVVLIGVTGSGKSTFAGRVFAATQVLSSDAFRALVADDENDQSATADAFAALNFIAGRRLAAGRRTVVDATNVQAGARASLIALAREHDVLPVAIVLDVGEAVCAARNAGRRDRELAPDVIRRQADQLRRSLKGLAREGFRVVHVLRTPSEVDRATVRITPMLTDFSAATGPFDIIGDVHGCLAELTALLGRLGYQVQRDAAGRGVDAASPEGRTAVFVGDLVDRGPDSPGVLRLVMGMSRAGHAMVLPGNHEDKLVRALRGRKVSATHGLETTLAQLADETAEFRAEVADFCYGLVSHRILDGGRLVVAHAGMKLAYQGRASGRVRAFALYGETTGESDEFGLPVRLPWAEGYRGSAAVIYGHTPTVDPTWVNNTLCLDTGCCFGGRLTALRYPERELVSVPAARVYYEPVRPLDPSIAERAPEVLELSDVLGRRGVDTQQLGRVTVREDSAAGALEVMSRFAVDPRWLLYLPPTMAPAPAAAQGPWLERPEPAFAEYLKAGVTEVICQEKHMGSRAVVLLRRRPTAGPGVPDGSSGIAYTRTGRPFFPPAEMMAFVAEIRAAVEAAGLFTDLGTDWLLLDGEILPWTAKAGPLVREHYAATGAAARSGAAAESTVLHAALHRLQGSADGSADELRLLAELRDRAMARAVQADTFTRAYRRYSAHGDALSGVTFAPFQVLAGHGAVHAGRDHEWQLAWADRLASVAPGRISPTRRLIVRTDDASSTAAGTAWWEALVGAGGEGMVVKPRAGLVRGRKGLVQPGLKVRGPEYLTLIYGPDYLAPERLATLRARNLGHKRSMALREYALGLESLGRVVGGEPLWRVHEPVFAVLALESEPVDPRL